MIIQGSPEILQGPRGLNNQFGAFAATDDTVVQLYQQILQRTPSASEIAYWSAGWGPTVEASEIRDFQQAAEPERIAADAWRAEQAAIAAAAQQAAAAAAAAQQAAAAAAAQQAAIEAANAKAVADAYAAAKKAAEAAAQAAVIDNAREQEAAFFRMQRAIAAVKALYLQVLGREGDTEGLRYFADKFGEVVDPDELQIFKNMAQPEIDARNKYLADMAAKSAKDAADAKAIADQFAKASADEAARQAAAAAAEAAKKKAIADAYAAAQAAAKAEELTRTAAAAAKREQAIAAVQILYLQVLGREGDQAGVDYFADKFGEVVDPDELQIFSDMAKPEIDARNAYLADMAKKSAEDAAKAKAIADEFKRVAEDAKKGATTMPVELCPPGYAWDGETCRPTGLTPPVNNFEDIYGGGTDGGGRAISTTGGGINPALILAAAAAAFFIGG